MPFQCLSSTPMNVVKNQSWKEEGKEYDIAEIEKEDEPYSHTKFKPEVIPFCWQCFESETWPFYAVLASRCCRT